MSVFFSMKLYWNLGCKIKGQNADFFKVMHTAGERLTLHSITFEKEEEVIDGVMLRDR